MPIYTLTHTYEAVNDAITKVGGIAENANNYTHPENHPPSIITQDASNRFVTDTEKSTWNGKQSALTFDSSPTSASTNPVTSGGVYTAFLGKIATTEKGAASGVASLTSDTKVTPSEASAKIVTVTASKTLALSDAGTLQYSTAATAITITIPLNSSVAFPVGTEIEIMNYGGGAITIAQYSTSVTLNGSTSTTQIIADQYTGAVLKQVSANVWVAQGAI